MSNQKIIVTGGSGFIGTNLIDFYINNNINVRNLDHLPPKKKEHFQYWVNVDITNYSELEKEILAINPDYVIHLAARTDLDGKKLVDYSANIVGVKNLVSVLKKITNLKRVIFTSSQLVCYGRQPKDDNDFNTINHYGESKRLGELIIRNDSEISFEWIIIRPTSIWGPWFKIPYRTFFDLILAHKYFHIGNYKCHKTYGYIGNTIYQINKIIYAPYDTVKQKVFYIGDDPPYSIEQWANEIANEIGSTVYRLPFIIFKMLALFGDVLKCIGVSFPMTSYRLYNLTNNNLCNVSSIMTLAPNLPFSRVEGVKQTLKWINNPK